MNDGHAVANNISIQCILLKKTFLTQKWLIIHQSDDQVIYINWVDERLNRRINFL